MHILISGAGIAGPAVAFWLQRYGFDTTVVERAPKLRVDGFAVDFRGSVHLSVLSRMGILDDVRAIQTNMGEQTVVSAAGQPLASLPSEFMSGDVEVLRGELSGVLHEHTKDHTEYVFGDHITGLQESLDGVSVEFASGTTGHYDLVIGADGLHSGVRSLAFGPESRFSRFHGYYLAGFPLDEFPGLDNSGLMYNEPGRGVMVGSNARMTDALLVFHSRDLGRVANPKQVVADAYANVGWETPRLLAAMERTDDLYFDSISTIHMDRFSKGRVVLLGDAGFGGTCGGMGTGAALVCAYVLAGELARADYRTAFARYESLVRPYVTGCQKSATRAGSFLAPRTSGQIWRRNKMYSLLSKPMLTNFFNKLTTKAASAISLPDYRLPADV
nr:FAD-dependent monooxygenase [Kibdelosporangium sp. MJ126-NF4]CEL17211.1 Oxidoreductase [Kibdelosporangium sp. MJ126-NF4]CTQ91559.1 Oxidoreductase [Kibdelosporangium sp. MJ126-NF4]